MMQEKMMEVMKEKPNLRNGMPMTWVLVAKRIPDEMFEANLAEFEQAIKSVS